jgi:hypothetical protein
MLELQEFIAVTLINFVIVSASAALGGLILMTLLASIIDLFSEQD